MQVIKYVFQPHGDSRGQLVALEELKDIPFKIKRVYYMYDTAEGVTRSYHAHKSLEQILVFIHGSCKIRLDNGFEKKVVPLEKPYEGLYVSCAMVLGDIIFYGGWFRKNLQEAVANAEQGHATIFGYYVKDPERFGIVEFDKDLNVISVEEKPSRPKSSYCITGLYFYDNRVVEYAKKVKPSLRGELEITDLNKLYLENRSLKVQVLGRGFAWLDTGTMDSLMDAAAFVQTVQNRQGVVISAPEEIAFHEEWISKEELLESAEMYGKSPYGEHLKRDAEGKMLFYR